MVVVLEKNVTDSQVENVIKHMTDFGFSVHTSSGDDQIILGAIGVQPDFDIRKVRVLSGVAEVYRITEPFKLASRNFQKENTLIKCKDIVIGGKDIVIMAGPCAVENEHQIFSVAESIANAGAKVLRGGAFKPRSSPYSFQGLGEEGLKLMRKAADAYGLLMVTEIIESNQVEMIEEYADILQVGARNMQNYPLIKAVGKAKKPVLLKRGFSSTIEEWLMSAEYILISGNRNVMLCERGIRTFETYTRNTFDLAAIPVVQNKSHLPVIADPSHATGLKDKVTPMARAAIAAGADGLLIEVHNDPEKALSDGPQALVPKEFEELMRQIRLIAKVIEREVI